MMSIDSLHIDDDAFKDCKSESWMHFKDRNIYCNNNDI